MSVFYFTKLVNDPPATVLTAALGVDADNKLADADIGKAVKLAANQNYVLCATGDEIEGFVSSVSAEATVNDGFSSGGVQVDRRHLAEIAETGPVAIGTIVVSGVPIALGTDGIAQVIEAATAATVPVYNAWRIIRHVTGTGVLGDTVLLEKV